MSVADRELAKTESRHQRDLLALAQLLLAGLSQTRRRALAAEAEVERLSERIRELEAAVEDRTAFDEVERIQLGRLLAAAEARRIEQLAKPLVSLRTVLLLLVCAALATLATLLVLGRVF